MDTSQHSDSQKNNAAAQSTSIGLIGRVQSNDRLAWEQLVNLYSPLVFYWCRQSGLKSQEIPDVFQEVFQAVASNVHAFEQKSNGSFRGWLKTITVNKSFDFFRRRGKHPEPIGGTEARQFFDQLPTADESPTLASERDSELVFVESHRKGCQRSDPVERQIHNAILRKALSKIRGQFKATTWQAFWKVVVDGRAASDVAAEMNMRPGTIRVAKSRVLNRLRQELGDAC